MIVICIDAKNNPKSKAPCDLIEGEIYNIIAEVLGMDIYGDIRTVYLIEGTDQKYAYEKWRFIPVSDIDETEMVRELSTFKQY